MPIAILRWRPPSQASRLVLATAVLLVGCSSSAEAPTATAVPGAVEVPHSEGGSAQLRIIDNSGLFLAARGVPDAGAADDLDIQQVPEAPDTVRVTWIGSVCEDTPQLTIDGASLDALELLLHRGPLRAGDCPAVGAVYGVDLVFAGDVGPDAIDAEMVAP